LFVCKSEHQDFKNAKEKTWDSASLRKETLKNRKEDFGSKVLKNREERLQKYDFKDREKKQSKKKRRVIRVKKQ
jgi:hypothetical protein